MTRLLLLLFAGTCLLPLSAVSQFDEVGIFMGVSHYSGDLSERKLEPLGFHRAGGVYLRKNISDHLGLKFQFMKAKVSGSDGNSSTESGLWRRNFSFESDIYELGAIAEYSFFKLKKGGFGTTPYVYAGLAGFYFSPMAELEGKDYALHVYKTEGVAYSLYQFAVPFGAGFRIQINGVGQLGLEAGFRKTFTDYLDDVSGFYPNDLGVIDGRNVSTRTQLSYRQPEVDPDAAVLPQPGGNRGNPAKDDWYMFFGVSVGVAIN